MSLSILIVLHEFGHFLPSRWFGIRVEKFYLFFDYKFSLFKKKIGDTEWGIGWIPLGGYVKIAGMMDESMDKEQLAQEPQPWEFRTKPAWQRLIIMLGGVTVNLILGFIIYSMVLFAYGSLELPMTSVKDGIWVTTEFGEELGFRTGDRILAMDGDRPTDWQEMREELLYTDKITVDRNGAEVVIDLPEDLTGQMSSGDRQARFFTFRIPFVIASLPDTSINAGIFKKGDRVLSVGGQDLEYYDQADVILKSLSGQTVTTELMRKGEMISVTTPISESGKFEVTVAGMGYEELDDYGIYEFDRKEYGFFDAFPAGWNLTKKKLSSYLRQFKLLFNPSTGAHKGLGGFGALGGLMPGEWGEWEQFWSITAFLSIILAVMNLLPIPLLDGGHVVFLLYEMISGRKPNEKVQGVLQMIGLVLLLALMLYANGNDLFRWLRSG